jgi:iron complex transport system ATP-binding protein
MSGDKGADLTGLQRPVRSGEGIISVSGLSFGYNGAPQTVLQDLSLEIAGGAVTALLGPNGSGKTTLLRLLLGVLHPGAGAVRLAGRPQSSYSRRELSQWIGLVPQDEHIPFDFSVLEYVLLGRAPYLGPLSMPGEADYRVALDALHMAGLEGLMHRPVPNLSGGERQLAVVARTLAQQPRILLMDEPAAHLDLSNQGRLLEIMRGLAVGGTTLVFTTHDPNLAAAVAGTVVLMRRGQILADGLAKTVLTSETLTATYGVAVQVVQIEGRQVVLLPDH